MYDSIAYRHGMPRTQLLAVLSFGAAHAVHLAEVAHANAAPQSKRPDPRRSRLATLFRRRSSFARTIGIARS